MTPSEKALRYAKDVVAGQIPNCKWVRLACQRYLDDLKKAKKKDWPFKYDPEKADRAVNFMQKMPHTKGKWSASNQNLIFEPWQCFIECNIFGWVHKKSGTRRFRTVFELIPRKNGKALEITTPVLTTNGWKNHGDLVEGDYVFAPSGEPVKVLWASDHYEGPCHEMKFSNGHSIIAHQNHEWVTERTWYTKRPRGRGGMVALPPVESKEIAATLRAGARGDFVHRIPLAAPVLYAPAELPVPPYTLGAWLGDGHSAAQNVTTMDADVLRAIEKDGYPCRRIHGDNGKAGTYSLFNGDRRLKNSTSLKSQLKRLGLIGNKHIPEIYLRASVEQRYELLRGLLDTDGFISKRGQIEFCSTNQTIAQQVEELVLALGMKPTLKREEARLYQKVYGYKYRLMFFPIGNVPLFKIQRKAERQKPSDSKKRRCQARTVINAERCGLYQVNCIEVAGGLYLAGKSLITTHNSARLAARGIYLFCADGESGAEVYSGATSEKQAHEVFRPAWMMVNKLKPLQDRFGISQAGNSKNPGTMFVMADMSKFETIIGKPGDGSSPHAALIDEYHEHDSDHMVDTMQTGMGAREQPLLCIITTAGSNLGGPCYEMQQDIQRILEGVTEDETVFGIMYGIDEGDTWDDPASLVKANPNYNVSVFGEFLLAQLEQARRSASKQNAFRTKHLNEWVGAKTAWMNMVAWQRQIKPMVMNDFKGVPCRVSVDLASKKDVVAVDTTFEKDSQYYSFKKFFAPEAAAEENEKYMEFVTASCLELTDGAMIDQEVIEDYLMELNRDFNVIDFNFDEWQADYMMARMMNKSLEVVKFPFNTRHVSVPMKSLEALVIDGKYWHDGNHMMNWMMSNVAAKLDARGNIFPNKARPNDPKCKIDGVATAIMSLGRWLIEDEPSPEYNMFFVG